MKQFTRQLDIIDPSLLKKKILIIGAGGIGSWTTLALAKMGCNDITVMDYDIVSEENIGSQIYTRTDIGLLKTDALFKNINCLVSDPQNIQRGYNLKTINSKWEPGMDLKYEIVISALDNMETRKCLWNDIKNNPYVLHYIDGRMGGEYFKILYLNLIKSDISLFEKYEKTLLPPEKIDPTPCTAKAIVYNTLMIGSTIASMVKNITTNKENRFEYCFDIVNFNCV